MKSKLLLWFGLVCGFCAMTYSSIAENTNRPYLNEAPVQREARFGMFIHWGLYSQAAGEWDGKAITGAGEWLMNDPQVPVTQYAKLVPQFNPVKFDAREWVRVAKNAGMKYIVITTKHHDSFALYPSVLTDWEFKVVKLGVIEIPTTGMITLSIRPVKEGWQPMNLKSLELKPSTQNP